jgi:hypothetical protein
MIVTTRRLIKYYMRSQAQWGTPVIPALERLRQEDLKFKSSLGCLVRPCLKKKKKVNANSRFKFFPDQTS